MKCEKGFKEENGKCVKQKKTYCDTNIVTPFVNGGQLRGIFGDEGMNRFGKTITGGRNIWAENRLRRVNRCVIDRKTLLSDIDYHKPAMGAVLTSVNLKNIRVEDIDGLEEGMKVFDLACSIEDKNSMFHKKFCKRNSIKQIKDLERADLNDVRHFGSAIKSKSNIFLTANGKDFRPVIKFSDIKLEGI